MDAASSAKANEAESSAVVEDLTKVPEPTYGMMFDTLDEMFEFYKNYAKHVGFPVRRRTSKRGDDGMLKYATFVCSREHKSSSASSNSLKPNANTGTECKARIRGCLELDGRWRLNSFVREHNHELCPSKARFFRCYREGSGRGMRRGKMGERAGITINKFVVEVGGREEVSEVRHLRLREGDAVAIQNYFLNMQIRDKGFFYSMDLDAVGRLKNVFWADGRSREAYKEFGEVVRFDTTYLADEYDMPFVIFVGVNHHGQALLFGCGLISYEDTETFSWLFRTWLACMFECAPHGLITDEDRAMQKAVATVFPSTKHRWCLWHIMNKFAKKLGGNKQWESIFLALQGAVYDSQSPDAFEQSWSAMLDNYMLHNNEWLSELYNEKRRWVPCFVENSFWAGMLPTQQNDNVNTFFDGYINSKTTLKQFVEQYGNAMKSKVAKESQSDFRSFSQIVPCVTSWDMEKQVQAVYTISKFKEFQNELVGKMYCDITSTREDCLVIEYDVREDVTLGELKKRMIFTVSFHRVECEVKCNCHLFEFRGILCRHAITVLIRNDVMVIPDKYVLRQWRKDVRRCHTMLKTNYDGISTPEQSRYDKMCDAFTTVADLAAGDEEGYIAVMEWISSATKKLPIKRLRSGSNQPTPKSTVSSINSEKEDCEGSSKI